MTILRAFTYIFDDSHWLKKMGELTLFVVLCFTPVIGLIPLCALPGLPDRDRAQCDERLSAAPCRNGIISARMSAKASMCLSR